MHGVSVKLGMGAGYPPHGRQLLLGVLHYAGAQSRVLRQNAVRGQGRAQEGGVGQRQAAGSGRQCRVSEGQVGGSRARKQRSRAWAGQATLPPPSNGLCLLLLLLPCRCYCFPHLPGQRSSTTTACCSSCTTSSARCLASAAAAPPAAPQGPTGACAGAPAWQALPRATGLAAAAAAAVSGGLACAAEVAGGLTWPMRTTASSKGQSQSASCLESRAGGGKLAGRWRATGWGWVVPTPCRRLLLLPPPSTLATWLHGVAASCPSTPTTSPPSTFPSVPMTAGPDLLMNPTPAPAPAPATGPATGPGPGSGSHPAASSPLPPSLAACSPLLVRAGA
ncbi:hypothetical protein V8C86DRAFT_1005821 [Haematococcus lacustris]